MAKTVVSLVQWGSQKQLDRINDFFDGETEDGYEVELRVNGIAIVPPPKKIPPTS